MNRAPALSTPRDAESSFAGLVRQVVEANPDPQDELDVAALLESLGWTDARAEEQFGHPDVFSLAREIFVEIRRELRQEPLFAGPRIRLWKLLFDSFLQFLHGLTFALPMAVATLAMILLHVTFIASLTLQVEQATALALATFLSYLCTGGYIQSMAHSVYLFLGLQEPLLARDTAWRLMRWGLWTSVVVALAALVLDLVFTLMPLRLVLFMDLYMILLSALWLSFAGIYVFRKEYLLGVITGAASLLTYGLYRQGIPLILAQVVSLIGAAATSTALSLWFLRRVTRRAESRRRVVEPRPSQIAYTTYRYFFYGILYFVFVYVDRLLAWTTNSAYMPYYVWFRGEYELGMDWAILSLILPLGVAEVLIHYISSWIQAEEQVTYAAQGERLARGLRRLYLRALAGYLLTGAASIALTRYAVDVAAGVPALAAAVPVHGVEPFVLQWATVGYALLAMGLFNELLLFSLNQPAPALRSLLGALAVDFIVGLVLTRASGHYEWAVWGLAAGSLYLLLASSVDVWRTWPKVDFVLYRMV